MGKSQHPIKGSLLITLAFFTATAVAAIVKSFGSSLNTWTIIFAQFAVCLLIISPSSIRHKGILKLYSSKHIFLLIARGISGVTSYFFAFLAIKYISLIDTTLLWNTGPIWVPFLAFIYFRENSFPWYAAVAAIFGFIGIIFVLQPDTHINSIGSFYALLSGVFFAVTVIANRQLAQIESHQTILAYYFTISMIVSFPFMVMNWVPLSLNSLFLLTLIGVGTYISQYWFTIASKVAQPVVLAPLSYTAVIFSALFDWYFWKVIPHWYTWIGSVLIISSCAMNIILSHRRNINVDTVNGKLS